jgi:hypothetical protein
MGKFILIVLIILAIPWAISTWWQIRRARGPKERAFLSRTSMGIGMFTMLAGVLLTILKGQALLFALPVIGVAALAMRHGWRKTRARIQEEERDPLSRARRVN